MVSVGLLFLSPPPLTSRPLVFPHSPSVERLSWVVSVAQAMVDKVHFLGYATHSATVLTRPQPRLGMHLPWSASTPFRASMSSRVHFVRRLHPNSAFAMNGQTPSCTSRAFSSTDNCPACHGLALLPLHFLCTSTCRSIAQVEYSLCR